MCIYMCTCLCVCVCLYACLLAHFSVCMYVGLGEYDTCIHASVCVRVCVSEKADHHGLSGIGLHAKAA